MHNGVLSVMPACLLAGWLCRRLGQIFGELAAYDEAGQLLTGSFMDYAMPRADLLRDVRFRDGSVPSPNNSLGVKGVGEAGTVRSTSSGHERRPGRAAPCRGHAVGYAGLALPHVACTPDIEGVAFRKRCHYGLCPRRPIHPWCSGRPGTERGFGYSRMSASRPGASSV